MSYTSSINVGDKIYGPENDGYRYTSYVCGFTENANGEIFVLTPMSFINHVSADDIYLRSRTSEFISVGKADLSPPQLLEKSANSLLGYFNLNPDTLVSSKFDPAMKLDEAIAGATVGFDGMSDDVANHFYVSNPNCWAHLDAGEIFDGLVRIRAHEGAGHLTLTPDNSLVGRLCRGEHGVLGVVIAIASEKKIIYILPFLDLQKHFHRNKFRFASAHSLENHNAIIAQKRTNEYGIIEIGELTKKLATSDTHVPNALANLERWIDELDVAPGIDSLPKIWQPIIDEAISINHDNDTFVKGQEGADNLMLVYSYLKRAYS